MAKISAKLITLGVVGTVIAGALALKTITTHQIEKNIDATLEKMGIKDQTSYDVSYSILDFTTRIEDLSIRLSPQETLNIDEIVVKDFDPDHNTPEFLEMEINGIHTDTKVFKADKTFNEIFKDLNKSELLTNIAINYKLDKEEKILDLKKISIDVEEIAAFSLAMQIHDIAILDRLTAATLMRQPQTIKIGKSTLTYKDESLADAVLNYNAKLAGQETSAFKANLLQTLEDATQKAKTLSRNHEAKFLQELAKFIQTPHSLKLSIDPKEAVSLGSLGVQKGDEALETLNFSISAN